MSRAGVRLTAGPVALATLAEVHGGTVDDGAGTLVIGCVASIEDGGEGALCPFTSRRNLAVALTSPAVLLVSAELAPLVPAGRRWVHPHASFALAGVLTNLEAFVESPAPPPASRAPFSNDVAPRNAASSRAAPIDARSIGAAPPSDVVSNPSRSSKRSALASIDPSAELADDVTVGPFAVIMAGVVIDARSVIGPHAVVYPRVRMGSGVVIGAGAIIGRAGFGWAEGPGGALRRVPQLGGVLIEDDVEVGPLGTVDAGTLGPTTLRRGTKLDAQVHVGHNAMLGPDVVVAAQSGFAGSVIVERGVRIGGQVGIADHVRVGQGARIAAKSGVIADVPAGETVAGYPAVTRLRWLRGMARLLRPGDKGK